MTNIASPHADGDQHVAEHRDKCRTDDHPNRWSSAATGNSAANTTMMPTTATFCTGRVSAFGNIPAPFHRSRVDSAQVQVGAQVVIVITARKTHACQ